MGSTIRIVDLVNTAGSERMSWCSVGRKIKLLESTRCLKFRFSSKCTREQRKRENRKKTQRRLRSFPAVAVTMGEGSVIG